MQNRYYRKRKIERFLGVFASGLLLFAGFLGFNRSESSIVPYLNQLVNGNEQFEQISKNTYKVVSVQGEFESGFIVIGEGNGYGGPLKVAALIDTNTSVRKLIVIEDNETPGYVEKVHDQKFHRQLIDKNYHHSFKLEDDLDAVSGATYTSAAIAEATKIACYTIAQEQKGIQLPELIKPSIKFGIPELLLIALYIMSLLSVYFKLKWKKTLRWIIMILGLLTLGFWFSVPLSLLKINSIIIGYWPQWHTNLYWYLLIGGGLITLISTNKRIYCNWICPFGAAQSCLGLIGGAKNSIKGKGKNYIVWIQRGLAFIAIATALYFRNPGKFSYEIFGTFFDFTGSSILFAITALYVLASMVIKRPYCNTLCPITPVEEFLLMFKRWIIPKKIAAKKSYKIAVSNKINIIKYT